MQDRQNRQISYPFVPERGRLRQQDPSVLGHLM